MKPLETRSPPRRCAPATGRVEAARSSAGNVPHPSADQTCQTVHEPAAIANGSNLNASKILPSDSRGGQPASREISRQNKSGDAGCFGKANTPAPGIVGGSVANGHSALLRRIAFSSEDSVTGEDGTAEPRNNATTDVSTFQRPPAMRARREDGRNGAASCDLDDGYTYRNREPANGDTYDYPTNGSQRIGDAGSHLQSSGHGQAAVRARVGSSYGSPKPRRNASQRLLGGREIPEKSRPVVDGSVDSVDRNPSDDSTVSSAKSRSVANFSTWCACILAAC